MNIDPLNIMAGERPSAEMLQRIVERLNELEQYAPSGVQINDAPPNAETTFIDLYELTGEPELDDDRREYKATARPVWLQWCQVDGDGHYTATSWQGGGTVQRARRQDTEDEVYVWFVAAGRDDEQEAAAQPQCSSGDRVLVTWWGDVLVVVAVAPNALLREFELKTALEPGGTATAHPIEDGTTDTESDSEFTVHDHFGTFRGRAKDAYGSPHDDGSKGVARWHPIYEEWHIIEMTPHALMLRGQLTADLVTADGTFYIDGVTVMQPTGGIITDQDPGSAVRGYNTFDHEGDEDGEVFVVWNENGGSPGRWDAIQVECPA